MFLSGGGKPMGSLNSDVVDKEETGFELLGAENRQSWGSGTSRRILFGAGRKGGSMESSEIV